MPLPKGFRRQIAWSILIVAVTAVYYFVSFEGDSTHAVMVGGEEFASMDGKIDELTWEVLVVDPQLRAKLWARYERSKIEEKDEALKAVIHMLPSLSPEQAEHLVKELLERSGDTHDRKHRQNLMGVMERLASRFKNVLPNLAHFAARVFSDSKTSTKRIDVNEMVQNVEVELKDTLLAHCLEGTDDKVKQCAEAVVSEKHPRGAEHLKAYLEHASATQRQDILSVAARGKMEFAKLWIPKLMASSNPMDVRTGLRLIREFNLVKYLDQVKGLQHSVNESLRSDVEATISYLSISRQ